MCVEWCCTFDGVFESEKKVCLSELWSWCFGVAGPGAHRRVCASGPHQGANRRAECGVDEAGDRGGDSACASGAPNRF